MRTGKNRNTPDVAYQRGKEHGEQVKRAAVGQWEFILLSLAGESLGPAIAAGPRKHVGCPFHGGRDGLRVFDDFAETGGITCNTCGFFPNGWRVLEDLLGYKNWEETKRIVGDLLGVPRPEGDKKEVTAVAPAPVRNIPAAPKLSAEEIARKDQWKADRMRETWAESYALDAPESEPARLYLEERGLVDVRGPLEDIRFHPALESLDQDHKSEGFFPTLLSLITQPNGKPLTIQRTYLTPEGRKANVAINKRFMGHRSDAQYLGSAVRLDHDVGPVLCVGEGVETMLAWRAMTGLPSWATCVALLLENLVIPDQVKIVIIASDLDPAKGNNDDGTGQRASKALLERVRSTGRKAAMILPTLPLEPGANKGPDWLDVLNHHGLRAARRQHFVTGLRSQIADMIEDLGLSWDDVHSHY